MTPSDSLGNTEAHPHLEELGALIDGTLSASDRRRVLGHVGTCPDCYEVFAGTARAVLDEAREAEREGAALVSRSATRFRRFLPYAIPLAAAAAAAVVILLLPTARTPSPAVVSVAEIVAPLAPDATVASRVRDHLDSHGFLLQRGEGEADRSPLAERSFRLGVRTAELEAALRAGDRETARRLTFRIEDELDDIPEGAYALVLYAGQDGVRGALAGSATLDELLDLTRQADRKLQEILSTDEYLLGRWIAAAELAAATGRLDRWATARNLRLLDRLAESDLPPAVRRDLTDLEALMESRSTAESGEALELLGRILLRASGGGTPDSR